MALYHIVQVHSTVKVALVGYLWLRPNFILIVTLATLAGYLWWKPNFTFLVTLADFYFVVIAIWHIIIARRLILNFHSIPLANQDGYFWRPLDVNLFVRRSILYLLSIPICHIVHFHSIPEANLVVGYFWWPPNFRLLSMISRIFPLIALYFHFKALCHIGHIVHFHTIPPANPIGYF